MDAYTKQYLKDRENDREKFGYYSLPISMEEFEEDNQKTWDQYLKDKKDRKKRAKLDLISLAAYAPRFGYLMAFQKQDYQLLNNVLWQDGMTNLKIDGILAGGGFFSGSVLNNLLLCFASNNTKPLEAFLLADTSGLHGTYYTENVLNLLKARYFQKDKEKALQLADTFLTKKRTLLELAYVRFFAALVKEDADGLSKALQELCIAYKRQGYPVKKRDKYFAGEIHGLYRLVRFFDQHLFEKVQMPDHSCFFIPFENWQKEHQYPQGTFFYSYPKEMNEINLLIAAKLPQIKTEMYYRKPVLDTDSFLKDLSDSVWKNIGEQ